MRESSTHGSSGKNGPGGEAAPLHPVLVSRGASLLVLVALNAVTGAAAVATVATAVCLAGAGCDVACGAGGVAGVEAEADLPPVPDSIHLRPIGIRGAEVGWRDRSDGRAWFAIERRETSKDAGAGADPASGPAGGDGFVRVGTRPPGQTSWEDLGLEPDSVYSYRVRAFDEAGWSAPSADVEIRTSPANVPDPVVVVFDPVSVSPGVTLFNVEDPDDVYSVNVIMAVDESGKVVWHFESVAHFITETDLYPDGDILAQVGAGIARFDRKGDLKYFVDDFLVHHDVDVLPWGNLLAITSVGIQEPYTRPEDALSRDWILEIVPETEEMVRTIHLEFLIPFEDYCRACVTTPVIGGMDWLHANSVDYCLEEEALYVSVRNLDRIYKLSYPEGEVQWVMGKGGDFGEGIFHHQHNPVRLGEGRMLLFDNGFHGDPLGIDRSRVIEIEFDAEIGQARIVWQYAGPPSFYSEAQGDASRLANGNTLVVDSFSGRIIEITPAGLPVWELRMPPPYLIYKAHRIENW